MWSICLYFNATPSVSFISYLPSCFIKIHSNFVLLREATLWMFMRHFMTKKVNFQLLCVCEIERKREGERLTSRKIPTKEIDLELILHWFWPSLDFLPLELLAYNLGRNMHISPSIDIDIFSKTKPENFLFTYSQNILYLIFFSQYRLDSSPR